MILSLKNIGKVESAKVELNGITVIAGENDTGKSTVGKALYSIFNSFYKIESKIQDEREDKIERLLDMFYHDVTNRMTMRVDTEEIAHTIIANIDKYRNNSTLLRSDIIEAISLSDSNFNKKTKDMTLEELNEIFKRIEDILAISDNDVFVSVLNKKLDVEFSGQVNNVFADASGEISLQIKNNIVAIEIEDNTVKSISENLHLNTEVIYIDDPFIMDERSYQVFYYRYENYLDHREHLLSKLFGREVDSNLITQIITTNKIDEIYSKINSICNGEMVQNKRRSFGYKSSGSNIVLHSKNVSAGLKTFVILKTLLQNGALEENGTIVLDEPEVHLHPEWQLLFAELIVLLQKEFGLHVLLNTHSPYFLRAIQVYSAKYEIADTCKYYLSEAKGERAYITDVTECIEQIYVKLSRPLQNLEDVRWQDDRPE